MKLHFFTIKKKEQNWRYFTLIPIILFAKDTEEKAEYGSVFFLWLWFGFGVTFKKKVPLKKYAVCRFGINGHLTRGKEYEIIKSVRVCYIVKRDDDSIDRVAQSRFYEAIMK
jgi:hypothetical protein